MARPDVSKTITINQAEFIRTRDAVVTSWTRLHGALQQAIQAYIEHSNAVLGGEEALDNNALQGLLSIAAAPPPVAASTTVVAEEAAKPKPEETAKEKKKRKREEKDPNYPKRPVTGYLLYLQDNRDAIAKDLGEGQARGQISQEGTRRWKELTDAQKDVYNKRYHQNFQDYLKVEKAYREAHGLPPKDIKSDEIKEPGTPAPKKRKTKATASAPAPSKAPTPPPEEADVESDAESSVVSSSSEEDSESEAPPPKPKSPTPVPVPKKTPKATKSTAFPAVNNASSKKKAAIDTSAAAVASSQPTPKKAKKTKEVAPPPAVPEPVKEASPAKTKPKKKRKSAALVEE